MKKPDSKIELFSKDQTYTSLSDDDKSFINTITGKYGFSYQEIKTLITVASDLEMWQEGQLQDIWDESGTEQLSGKALRQKLLIPVKEAWYSLKKGLNDYSGFTVTNKPQRKLEYASIGDDSNILGTCPVASEKTRCCNLQTLDAVINCGYGCSYCSIQSFYTGGKIFFHKNLKEKLKALDLDPDKIYHIGTGQSSDSLMWGNREGILDVLTEFAADNPNVILELKTKSGRPPYIRENRIPSNIIITWSLNPDTIITSEEHYTASLDERLSGVREAADRGILVGFHFHPIIEYSGWEKEYSAITTRIQEEFTPEETALISLGTLTFIKPVIKQLRLGKIHSKILQMELTDSGGKLSYPLETKRNLFRTIYNQFSENWKNDVYFYMCMEDKSLWKDVFGREYGSNTEFESDMKSNYMRKIKWVENRKRNTTPVN